MKKQLWILAGGNGAGKSSFYESYLKSYDISFVNADRIAKETSSKIDAKVSKQAQEQAMAACEQKLKDGETFCFETVFSHPSKIDLIMKAKKLGYEVNLVFIHLSSSALNKARVLQRVKSGGHNVPPKKIESRIPRTIENIKEAVKLVDNARLIDNSSGEDPLKTVVVIKNKKIIYKKEFLPDWVSEIIKGL